MLKSGRGQQPLRNIIWKKYEVRVQKNYITCVRKCGGWNNRQANRTSINFRIRCW